MALNSDREKLMRLYLLGRLSDEEKSEIESEYVADEGPFEEILAVEDDLRDAYARSELSSADREAFEQRFVGLPDQVQKLEFAKVLQRYLSQKPKTPAELRLERGWQFWMAQVGGRPRAALAIAVVLVLAILAVGGGWLNLFRQHAVQTVVTAPTSPSLSTPIEIPPAQIVTLVLTPGSVRGLVQASRVLIPRTVKVVRLDLRFEDGRYTEFQTVLETAENKPVWNQDGLVSSRTASGPRVVVDVPANLLATGDYVASVRGRTSQGSFETVADYAFRVVRE